MNSILPLAWEPGPLDLLIILFVILLLFGTKKLPELARSLGKSVSEFKKGKEEGEKTEHAQEPPKPGAEVK